MTPAKRRPATPVSQGPTQTTPDVPIVAKRPPVRAAKTTDDTQLLGPEGDPIAQEAATRDVGGNSASPAPARRRPSGYPLPVWPD
jgi:hypothetical protein